MLRKLKAGKSFYYLGITKAQPDLIKSKDEPMKISFYIGLLVMFSINCAGYRSITFNNEVRDRYRISSEDLTKIQFYTSGNIILVREIINEGLSISGKLTKREATEIKQIIIKSGSPCIIKKTVRGVSYVYFEPDKYLIFETDREGYIRIKHTDKVVDYGNEKYNMQRKPKIHWRRINIFAPLFAKLRYIVFRSNYKKIYLVVDAKALEKYKVDTKRVKGMKLK